MFGWFWCTLGWHAPEQVHDMPPEEAGRRIAGAKSGAEILGILLAGASMYKYVCKRCHREVKL